MFKLERERPAYATHGETLYYVKERHLRSYDFSSQRDSPLISIRRIGSTGASTAANSSPLRFLLPLLTVVFLSILVRCALAVAMFACR